MTRIALIASLVALGLAGYVAFDRFQPRSGGADPRVDQLQAKVDGLEKTLAAQAKLIGGPAPSGAAGAAPADGDRVAAVERKIDQLAAELEPILSMIRQQKEMEAKLSPEANAAFAADFEKREGVKKTASGLMYRIVEAGPDGGKSPSATSEVTVNYEGKMVDGQVFDSSYARGEPATFPLNQVIPGWTEGLQLMKEGDTAEFVIPAALAYGPEGNSRIPGNQTLFFKVELIKVN